MSEKRTMGFIEIGKGALGRDVQRCFEQAQSIATIRGCATKVTLQIGISPPSEDRDGSVYGSVAYTTKVTEPPKSSKTYETVIKDGLSVRDAETPMEQLDLLPNDSEDNVIHLKQHESN